MVMRGNTQDFNRELIGLDSYLVYMNQLAKLETWNKHNYRPSNYIHKWWARRPGTVFRMILLGVFAKPGEDLVRLYYNGVKFHDVIVYDPFMGGGTTLIEANRIGCKVIGVDINPVAWFIVKKALEPVKIELLDEAYNRLKEGVGKKIKTLYKTRCPVCQEPCDTKFYLWVKVTLCPNCGTYIRLYRNYLLRRDLDFNIVLCPRCYTVFRAPIGNNVECPHCAYKFDPYKRFVTRGYFTCPNCHIKYRVFDITKNKKSPLDQVISCVVLRCPNDGLQFKHPDREDIRLYEKAREIFKEQQDNLLIPTQPIPPGLKTNDLLNMGYRYWYQLFNERQLLALSQLLTAILKLDEPAREFMLLCFSNSLEFNNMLCSYKGAGIRRAGAVRHIFSHHAFVRTLEPLENNLWGSERDSGTFPYIYKHRLRRAKLYSQRPEERVISRGKVVAKKVVPGESVKAIIGSHFRDLKDGKANALVLCDDARRVTLPSNSIDAVITDPPYFDNIQYSELSNFFYVWLRLGLKDKYEVFKPELVVGKDEVVKNPKANKDAEFFRRRLTQIFKKCGEALKDNGVLVFTFHHRDEEAWETILRAIIDSGFYVSETYPVYSEMAISVHIRGQDAVKHDTIIVCRKRNKIPHPIGWISIAREAIVKANKRAQLLIKAGIELTPADLRNLVYAKYLELYTKYYPNVFYNGQRIEPVDVFRLAKEFLQHIIIDNKSFTRS